MTYDKKQNEFNYRRILSLEIMPHNWILSSDAAENYDVAWEVGGLVHPCKVWHTTKSKINLIIVVSEYQWVVDWSNREKLDIRQESK